MPAIRDFAVNDHADRVIDIEDAFVGAIDKEFGEDLFFSSQDDSIFALNSNDCPELVGKYSADSTAFTAYSSWSKRPSWV